MLIYFDNNATTKVDEQVLESMLPFFKSEYANPSSIYSFSASASKAIKTSRAVIKEFLGAQTDREILFTGSGSESANTAIKGVLANDRNKKHIITTKVEHPCVLNLYKLLEKQGYKVDYIDVNSNGELLIEDLVQKITNDTALVSVMWANNETGIIFPVEKIGELIKSKNPNTVFFVDGVQIAGKMPINVKDTNIDLLGISGHKFHAPKGIGALYIKSGTMLSPLIVGGHQERGRRAGTENVPYIAGMAKAAELAIDAMEFELNEVARMRNKLESGILKAVFNSRLNSGISNRVPNTTNIGFEYIEGELILLHLSDVGIYASSGSACTSGSLEPSHVLKAMGLPFTSLHGSIRFSLSRYTTDAEVDYVIEKLPPIIEKIVQISPYQDELNAIRKLKNL